MSLRIYINARMLQNAIRYSAWYIATQLDQLMTKLIWTWTQNILLIYTQLHTHLLNNNGEFCFGIGDRQQVDESQLDAEICSVIYRKYI